MSHRINKDQVWLFYEHGIELSTKTLYLGFGADEEVDLDQKVTADVLKGLHILSSIRPEEPIRIMMNNQGGDTQHGLAIYDAIRNVSSPVHITVYGHAYSIAAWILQAGDVRRMSKHSSLMIHDGQGTKSRFFKEQDSLCRDILLQRIKEKHPEYSAARLQKLLDTDTYLWPQQALELGLIDEVVE